MAARSDSLESVSTADQHQEACSGSAWHIELTHKTKRGSLLQGPVNILSEWPKDKFSLGILT